MTEQEQIEEMEELLYKKLLREAKYEAVKEFAKEVKECKTIKELVELGYIASYVDVCKEIDELLKEYEI